MKKIMIYLLVAIIGFTSVMTPFYSKAAMASDIALDAEVSELFYTIMINAMVAAGFMEADDMEYDDAMSCFESFCDAVVPVGTRTDSAGYAVDSSGNRLILLQNSAGASIDLSNIITDGTSALKPAKEQWEKFKVIQGGSGGSNNNPLGNGNIDSAVLGAPIFEAARAWMLANQNNLPVKQQAPAKTASGFNGVIPDTCIVNDVFYYSNASNGLYKRERKFTFNNFNCCLVRLGSGSSGFSLWYYDRGSKNLKGWGNYFDCLKTFYYNNGVVESESSKDVCSVYEPIANIPMFETSEAALSWFNHYYFGVELPDGCHFINGEALDFPGLISLVPSMFDVLAGQKASIEDLLNLKPKLKAALDAMPALDPAADPAINNDKVKDTVQDAVKKAVPATDPAQDPIIAPVPDADIKKYTYDLSTVFPFCVPFDLVALLKTLCADAKTPKFEVPIAFPAIDYGYTFVIDLSFLDSAAQVFRACITVSFILALISITPKMIKW